MGPIASHPYVEIIRKIECNEQKYIETHHVLHLFSDRIITSTKEFHIDQVFDISFRQNFLYLHTHQGVVSFNVKTAPTHFLHSFQKLKLLNKGGI